MTAVEQVKEAVLRRLRQAGLTALPRYGTAERRERNGAVAAVGVAALAGSEGGLGAYLGMVTGADGESRELYGRRLELEIRVDIYAPTAAEVEEGTARAAEALLTGLPSGLRPGEGRWGETGWDRERELFLCRGTLGFAAYFTAEGTAEEGEFLDFKLKGVIGDAKHGT